MPLAPWVTVVMPTFEQAAFLPRAVASLRRQTCTRWELVVVDDGSQDATATVLDGLDDPRIHIHHHALNRGLGAACNAGLERARAPLVAYLPSDDVWFPDHLSVLLSCLDADDVALVWSGARTDGPAPPDPDEGVSLQLVQVLHRRTGDRWTERDELESDDLDRLFWGRLRRRGRVVSTGRETCAWVSHPGQRHRVIRERDDGGLNPFRARYRVGTPLRFQSTDGPFVDERALYARFRDRPAAPAVDGLRILLVGELAFNPERVLALEQRGHELFGLWIDDPLGPSTVGPLPFGHVRGLPRRGWRDTVRRLRPDVIYGLLNWRAVPLVAEVLDADPGIPVVWHFKESPQRCVARGTWPPLTELHRRADAVVYSSDLEREWFDVVLPGARDPGRTAVLDGDLPKGEWLDGTPSPRLSEADGEVHTVCIGRPLGLDADAVARLAAARIHLHLHGLVRGPGPAGAWTGWLAEARRRAPGRVHVHPHVDQRSWVAQLSRYDAAWLHRFRSSNGGDLQRATWDDLNVPARLAVAAVAGLPVLQQSSPGSSVAVQDLVRDEGIGLLYDDLEDLSALLSERRQVEAARDRLAGRREQFTFDAHADRLVDLFRQVAR